MTAKRGIACFALLLGIVVALASSAWAGTYSFAVMEFPPFQYQDRGKAKGVTIDLVSEAMRRIGHSATFTFMPWARAQRMVRDGKSDAIVLVFKTQERMQYMLYSDVLVVEENLFLVRKDSEFGYSGVLSDLRHTHLGSVLGYSYGTRFDSAKRAGVFYNLHQAVTLEGAMRMLNAGRYEALICQRLGALAVMKRLGMREKMRFIMPAVQYSPAHVGFSRALEHDDLCDAFNDALQSMRSDGTYEKILQQYLQ